MTTDQNEFYELAHGKLTRVFGEVKAEQLLREIVTDGAMPEISTAQDLLAFAEALKRRGGFEATVGAMLGLEAVLRGADAA